MEGFTRSCKHASIEKPLSSRTMKETDQLYVSLILEHCLTIQQYTAGLSKQAFLANQMAQDATLMQLTALSECVGKLSDELLEQYPDIPVRQIKGLRNRIVHDYVNVDQERIWDTVFRDIKLMEETILRILDEH